MVPDGEKRTYGRSKAKVMRLKDGVAIITGAAMAFSSVSMVPNSLSMRRFRLQRIFQEGG